MGDAQPAPKQPRAQGAVYSGCAKTQKNGDSSLLSGKRSSPLATPFRHDSQHVHQTPHCAFCHHLPCQVATSGLPIPVAMIAQRRRRRCRRPGLERRWKLRHRNMHRTARSDFFGQRRGPGEVRFITRRNGGAIKRTAHAAVARLARAALVVQTRPVDVTRIVPGNSAQGVCGVPGGGLRYGTRTPAHSEVLNSPCMHLMSY